MTKQPEKPDHGTFGLHSPQEGVMLVQLVERARKNKEKPDQAWGRIEGTQSVNGKTVEGIKTYHVNLATNRLTVTEVWAGKETARKTTDLHAGANMDVPDELSPPPDPGSPTPAFHRMPFHSADLLPEEELQEWAMKRADKDVSELSVLPRRIRLVGEGFQEVVALPQALAANIAPGTGATLRALSARKGVERRLVEGWFGSVDGRGTAWILEVGNDNEWWLAVRAFERRPGLIGRWTSTWSQRTGTGVEAIPSSFLAILDPPPDEKAIPVGKPQQPAAPDFGMFPGSLPPEEVVPATAEAVADRVGRDWEANLPLGKAPEGPRLTVFRGHEWETWVLDGEFPMGLDDMIRAISARGEPPTSLALVRMGVIPLEGDVYRALITEGEAQGRRYTRALLIRLAPDDTVLGYRLACCDHGEMGDDGWIGVEPITEMSLFTLNSGEA